MRNVLLEKNLFWVLLTNIWFIVEFRVMSWMRDETWWLLKNMRWLTQCNMPLLPEVEVSLKIAYFRWHGRG